MRSWLARSPSPLKIFGPRHVVRRLSALVHDVEEVLEVGEALVLLAGLGEPVAAVQLHSGGDGAFRRLLVPQQVLESGQRLRPLAGAAAAQRRHHGRAQLALLARGDVLRGHAAHAAVAANELDERGVPDRVEDGVVVPLEHDGIGVIHERLNQLARGPRVAARHEDAPGGAELLIKVCHGHAARRVLHPRVLAVARHLLQQPHDGTPICPPRAVNGDAGAGTGRNEKRIVVPRRVLARRRCQLLCVDSNGAPCLPLQRFK
mmetsp:Transcript_5109/g.14508  ORF Transcript_5109/g.14508 Transcript_5109/m.14508 type:complete len:261 (-) Transcript_5109:819-1601(-)